MFLKLPTRITGGIMFVVKSAIHSELGLLEDKRSYFLKLKSLVLKLYLLNLIK